ncbi:thiosulfate sulfurtransferase [Chelatococcus reniformis]|uniref:Thiosulfate sulfurtransferase n=2 Tax=Chelatococcus reniformis TaxID=1494448 RepID=A0A916UJA7_9HYPH|nr:thiosulfate sulfurtransferase [Chelatococcus reniformis]
MGRHEIALIDVREAKVFAQGHINLSSHQALSSLEVQIPRTVPRTSVPIVIVDDEGKELAHDAQDRLRSLGYVDVRILAGGIAAWAAGGYALGTGYNTLVKAFADLAHARYGTPTITPAQLQGRLDRGQPTTLIDCRPAHEHQNLSLAGARNAAGVELALHDLHANADPDHLWVVSCFSRTRGIVGTTTLARLDRRANVAFLEDGIMAAVLHGLPTGPGHSRAPPPAPFTAEDALRHQAEGIVKQYGLRVIDRAQYLNFVAESAERTLYVFDVRPEAAYRQGHLPEALSSPGGQLVMTYDVQVAVRGARIILVDDAHLKRAAVTAFWLSHFDDAEIHILPLDAPGSAALAAASLPAEPDDVRQLAPEEAAARIADGLQVVDVGPSLGFEQGHIPGARFVLRSAWPAWIAAHGAPEAVLFTSPDGLNAAYAASESRRLFGIDAYTVAGGTQAWRAAGLPIEVDYEPAQLLSPFDDDWGSPMRLKVQRDQPFRDYLTWERGLGHSVPQDDTVRFRWLGPGAAEGAIS